MAYTYDPIFAADPNNAANVAANAAILLFDPADNGKAPITITDVTGSPLPNPITVNRNGFGPAFQHATLDRVGWFGAGFTGYFTSYEGMKAVAVEAAAEATAASATAAAAAEADLAARIAAGQFKGDPGTNGQNGSNVLPTDTAIKNAITTPGTETATALSATIDTQVSTKSAVLMDGVKVDTFEVDSTPGLYAPAVIVPPTSVIAIAGDAVWPLADKAYFTRFTLPVARTYRYFGLKIAVASGNFQVGVVKIDGLNYTRVMSSGVIAATVGDLRLDLGATELPAGDYALFFWADNNVLSTRHASNSIVASLQAAKEMTMVGGVPASGALTGGGFASSMYLTGLSLAAS